MKKVTTTALPLHSVLYERVQTSDFMDCYRVDSTLTPRQAAEVITNFPCWVRALIRVRNGLTMPWGLSQNGPMAADKVGFFPIEQANDTELIAGFNDKHLDFRISVLSDKGAIYLATWVHPHNLGGKLYLNTILPFHVLVARDALARVGDIG